MIQGIFDQTGRRFAGFLRKNSQKFTFPTFPTPTKKYFNENWNPDFQISLARSNSLCFKNLTYTKIVEKCACIPQAKMF